MTRIVRTTYRYKRPPRKRKAIALDVPAVTPKAKPGSDNRPDPAPLPTEGEKSAIVTVRRRGRFGDALDLMPEEHQRRGDAADALWRELVRRATDKP